MISAKNQETLQRTVVVNLKTSPGKLAMMPDAVPSDSKIRERAYELYENRGREPGQEEQDWFRAEREILNR